MIPTLGVKVAAALTWPLPINGQTPGKPDLPGAGLCIAGAAVILVDTRA